MGFLTTTDIQKKPSPLAFSDQALSDLMLTDYLNRIFESHHGSVSLDWTKYFTTDQADLVYRREVLGELSANQDLVESITAVCKTLSEIRQMQQMPPSGEFYAESIREFSVLHLAFQTMSSLSEKLTDLIGQGKITSRGLQKLSEVISEKVKTNFTKDFETTYAQYAGGLEQLGSFRVRFTLNQKMQIEGVALTHIQKEKFIKSALTSHVQKDLRQADKLWDLSPLKEMKTPTEELTRVQLMNNQKQFFAALSRITNDLEDLYQDLTFYLGALLYLRQMRKTGTKVCYPTILPKEDKAFRVKEMVNPILTVFKRGATVPNDIEFKDGGEILVLTGINQGGKTTFLRSVGVTQAFFQLGWPVSCEEASLSIVDGIHTVFSHEENTNLQHGKLGQELKTLREGLTGCGEYALLLCNEPITGTSPMENLYLSREVLSACKIRGLRGVWVTHIYDLASGADEMNAAITGSTISSIIALAKGSGKDVSASYRIIRSQPQFTSFAKEVLQKETGVF